MADGKNNILTQKGCKNTKARAAVVEILQRVSQPVTTEDIFIRIRQQGLPINLSTVYRTLELMESKGLVEKVILNGGRAMYELTGKGHRHHLICTGCSRMVTVDACPLKVLEKEVGENTDFDITGHKLELYGLCPECKKART